MFDLNYMYNCFKNLKNTFQNYQAYANSYEACQYVSHGNESVLNLSYPPVAASSMQNFLPGIVETFACGVFGFTDLICSEKKYFCQKKISSFDAYYVDECDTKNGDDYEDNEYNFIEEYDLGDNDEISDADILSAYIAEYGMANEEYDTGVLSDEEDETEYLLARTLNDFWGFIDSDDLSVEFKDTTPVLKRSRNVVDISDQILAQAKKDYFKGFASKPKQNLSRQSRMIARLSSENLSRRN
ncbi:hypothetical protein MFLAVUS_006966 [Mucor flavus]|uniref:Uncharacterized protein n=1 Tax=Mucor flavus TaxID=439312 RepID=A0ABP9Z308_9FUNG